MDQVVPKRVKFDLTSVDSNAYSLMGHFRRAARKAGWTQEEVGKVLAECRSGDYYHLAVTLQNHCE